MNDQAKRWTAELDAESDRYGFVLCDGFTVAECPTTLDARRLAACANLLREHADLSGVVVVDKSALARALDCAERLAQHCADAEDVRAKGMVDSILRALLPVSPEAGK